MDARNIEQQQDPVPPSMTAMQVAQAYYMSAKFHHFPYDDSKKLIKYLVAWAKHAYPVSSKWITQLYDTLPMPLVKGICTIFKAKNYQGFIATRKAYISQAVDNAIQEGAEQVLVIGGGFDVMATVKHKQFTNVHFYELDRGPHQKMKQEALRDLREGNFAHHDVKVLASGLQNYAELSPNMHFIEADLSQPGWQELLTSHGFNPEKKTICIGEGLTMYLTQEEVTNLLSSLLIILHEDSRLILSFMDPGRNTNTDKFADHIRGATNEKYKANIAATDVPEFMLKNGFSVIESLPREEIQKSLGLPESKMHLSAGLSENYFLAKPSKPGADLQPISIYKL